MANDLVLVAVITRRKDFDLVLSQRWYRIPVKHAPVRQAAFVALYQTAAFGGEGRQIRYYARIRRVTVARRAALLPDEPDHPRSGDLYYRLRLGQVRTLPRPIRNAGKHRVTFAFTTHMALLGAQNVCDLFGVPAAELIMGRLLKRHRIRAAAEHRIVERGRCRYRLDFAVICRNGKIAIECDNPTSHSSRTQRMRDRVRDRFLTRRGWTVVRLAGDAIMEQPDACIRTIQSAIRSLCGPTRQ